MIDTHAHLDFSEFDPDRAAVFAAMAAVGVTGAIIPGVSPRHWDKQVAVAAEFDCYFALGIHPWHCPPALEPAMSELEALVNRHLGNKRLVAIGECGLDKRHSQPWPLQVAYVQAQLDLAKRTDLPLILHVVKAHGEMLALLKASRPARGGVVHAFSAGPEVAHEYIKLGFKLGVGGLVVNPNAKKLHKTLAEMPLSAFVLETDSPAMTPITSAVSRNDPTNLVQFVDEIAQIRKKTNVLISEQLQVNARQLFDL
ncbi:TatD family hydrolase [Shewanella sp. AS16]|uniref:TatD family hydrolase n=1 Tax=Shewanella sp. AS16 TaxID=2907625 RepID=UPI001F2A0E63|nr:TatD family hydrolase [Shewanella sp. AS16]MCE9686398.1 TatD family hydrolase [Shewanella sp. AS16]